jgi:biopolymer transport protein ExbB
MSGGSIAVPIDISRGAALRQLTHRLNIWEQIPQGGPIVYPIIGIFALAVLIIVERCIYLFAKSVNAESLMQSVCMHAENQDWDACAAVCEAVRSKPIPKVLLAGIKFKDFSRQDLENVLQEAILNEIPRLERFLSTLGMLAVIAPLLGLLGTVTGMINTFNVITFFGTGDPKMMSGGISEALITTMLGLAAAIPIMLSHTLLNRKVETMISQMEEKSVAFVNTLFKSKSGS